MVISHRPHKDHPWIHPSSMDPIFIRGDRPEAGHRSAGGHRCRDAPESGVGSHPLRDDSEPFRATFQRAQRGRGMWDVGWDGMPHLGDFLWLSLILEMVI